MNPAAELPPPQPLPQPHRSSFSCDRHPAEQFAGFCPECLCERLTTLDQSSSSRKPSSTGNTTAAALRAIFKLPGNTSSVNSSNRKPFPSSSFLPELRRTQSFSASKNEGFSGVFEPQRKSCDVRARNSLWSLFSIDDDRKSSKNDHSIEVETRNLGSVSSRVTGPVLESKEEDEHHDDDDDDDDDVDEITIFDEPNVANVVEETVEEDIVEEFQEEVKTMKDHIGLDSQAKKPSVIAGSFWSAASVFGKKWHNWRQKQKLKKRNTGGESAALPIDKPISRQYRETQSEIADYGFGRRSCDTGPRFSLDAGRMSFDAARISYDDPRYSFDEPRASWDGHLIVRTFPRLPPMVSVVEDAPAAHVSRSDTQIPVVEEPPVDFIKEDETNLTIPGGSVQTREYYLDTCSSQRRRKSLDRSSSIRKIAAAVVAEIDEMKAVSNAKVSPETIDYLHGTKLLSVGDGELRDLNSNSLRDDCSETFELGFGDINASAVVGNVEQKGSKKFRKWSKPWKFWGFIYHRRGGGNKDEDEVEVEVEERYSSRVNGSSFSEPWQELRREEGNGEAKVVGGFNRNMFLRSNSSVSWRNGGSFGSVGGGKSVETNGHGEKRRDEFVLKRNQSARYSPKNGLLRFYLTPMRGTRRSGGSANNTTRPNNSSLSFARSVF